MPHGGPGLARRLQHLRDDGHDARRLLVGGPQADTGLTGRKIIVDTYGGWAAHGGGAFSGKDPTKVDRSAGYMARYVAKNIVAAGLADECLLQLAYCIGLADPVSVMVNTYGTGKLPDGALSELVRKVFPLSPKGIIDHLKLREPIYRKTAAYGHFGRPASPGKSWMPPRNSSPTRQSSRTYPPKLKQHRKSRG